MALSAAVQGARHTAQQITWTDDESNAVNLTGATLTGFIRQNKAVRTITGTLAIVTAASGIFNWTYSAADVATDGGAEVQFVATYADTTKDKTLVTAWFVHDSMGEDVPV